MLVIIFHVPPVLPHHYFSICRPLDLDCPLSCKYCVAWWIVGSVLFFPYLCAIIDRQAILFRKPSLVIEVQCVSQEAMVQVHEKSFLFKFLLKSAERWNAWWRYTTQSSMNSSEISLIRVSRYPKWFWCGSKVTWTKHVKLTLDVHVIVLVLYAHATFDLV